MKLPINYNTTTWQERRKARAQYVKQQNGNCMFCRAPLDSVPPDRVTGKKINWALFPENFLKYPVHLQHDHATGMTEGAVHAYCNAVMWQYHGR